MTLITREEVLKIARMSHIELKNNEIEPLMRQLEQVLTYAHRVVEVAGVVQSDRYKQKNIMRPDEAVLQPAEPLLAQAPEREGNFFVVPAILETHK